MMVTNKTRRILKRVVNNLLVWALCAVGTFMILTAGIALSMHAETELEWIAMCFAVSASADTLVLLSDMSEE